MRRGASATMAGRPQTCSPMADNKSTSRRYIEMWSSESPLQLEAVCTAAYRNHQEPLADGGVGGLDLAAMQKVIEGHRVAFPATKVEILSQLAESDRVATHWRFSGTQSGPYEGRPGSDKPVRWTGVQIDRFEDGKIAESWVAWDKYTLFQQLGALD